MFFSPLVLLSMLLLVLSLAVLFVVVQLGIIGYAFEKVGVPQESLFSLLMLSWFGSWINIPVARLRTGAPLSEGMVIYFFGQRYLVPRWRRQETVVAVNVGGAVVPALLSLYLLTQAQAPLRVLVATAIVAAITHVFARPVRGLGIAVPLFLPPLCAALVALLLVPAQAPPGRIRGRHPGHADRCRSSQSAQNRQLGRAGGLSWRGGNI
ncbi:MAG: hypothetical protein KatS3mg131_2476 [Candidatus Tectimicrobiota bacterium]|nr:MAG: hypothetical protein KatS3mg131_2476 [Candidatus Tectomicrobia bacterium]